MTSIALALCSTSMATASPEIGVRLGTVSLTDSKDRDIVHLAPCSDSSNLRVSRIKFTVNAYPAQVDDHVDEYNCDGMTTTRPTTPLSLTMTTETIEFSTTGTRKATKHMRTTGIDFHTTTSTPY